MSCFLEQARTNFWVGAIAARKRSECGFKPAPYPTERRCPFFDDLILKRSEAGLNPINRHEMRAPNVGSGRMLSCAPAGYSRSLDRDRNGLRKGRPEGRPLFMGRLRPSNTNQFGAVGVTQVGEIRSVRTDAGWVFD
jgi:hypothetical protein